MKLNLLFIPCCLTTLLPCLSYCSCSSDDKLKKQLSELENVDHIDVYDNVPNYGKSYIVWFKQPIDWNNPSLGYFNQRVQIKFKSYDAINVETISGYELIESRITDGSQNELEKICNGNSIKIENRYYGKSIPTNLDNNKVGLWKYLNYENTIKDFHFINKELKKVFTNKWLLNGGSKGGQIVDIYAMKQPTDFNAFVSFVSPRCFETSPTNPTDEQKGFHQRIYSSIGDDSSLGTETAKEYRKDILTMQYHLLSNMGTTQDENSLLSLFIKDCQEKKYNFVPLAQQHPQYLYLGCAIELATNFWQTQWQSDIQNVKDINALYDSNKQKCLDKSFKYMLNLIDGKEFSRNNPHFAYKYQGLREMGLYSYNFSALEEALKSTFSLTDAQIAELIPIDSSDKSNFPCNLFFSPEQLASPDFTYDSTIKGQINQWMNQKHDGVNIIQIYGKTDPWYYYSFDCSRAINIHLYVDQLSPHLASISSLPQQQQDEIKTLLNLWLK